MTAAVLRLIRIKVGNAGSRRRNGIGHEGGVLTFHNCINYGSYWQAPSIVETFRQRRPVMSCSTMIAKARSGPLLAGLLLIPAQKEAKSRSERTKDILVTLETSVRS